MTSIFEKEITFLRLRIGKLLRGTKFPTNLTFLNFIQKGIAREFVKMCFFPALPGKINCIGISKDMRRQAMKILVFLPRTALK